MRQASVTLDIQGHVNAIGDAAGLLNGLGFNTGDTFQFSATLADATPPPDTDPRSMFGNFGFSSGPSTLTLSGHSFSATELQIQTWDMDATMAPFTDQITLSPYGVFTSTVPSPALWGGFFLTLDSGDTTTLTTDALDFGSALWTNYALSNLQLYFFDDRTLGSGQSASLVLGAIDNVTITNSQVPEPGSLILLGTGVMTVLARRRRVSVRETRR